MVDIATLFAGRGAASAAELRVDRHEVDQRGARSELDQAELVDASLDFASESVAVEPEGGVEVAHAQDDMVEAFEIDRVHSGTLDPWRSAVSHGGDRAPSGIP